MGVGVKKRLRELTNQLFSNRAGESYSRVTSLHLDLHLNLEEGGGCIFSRLPK